MKVWDFKGSLIRDIESCTSDYSYFINVWYDNEKIYIINANSWCINLYEYHTGELVKSFDEESETSHMSASVHYLGRGLIYMGLMGLDS
jgi:hypothetical protein